MPDFSKLSDADLKQLAEGGDFRTGVTVPAQSQPDMSTLTDAELQKLASGEDDSHWFGPGGKVPQWMNEHPNVRSLTKGTLDLLPVAGATAGGAVGTAAGLASSVPTGLLSAPVMAPVAGVAGAGLGGGMGKSLQNLGEDALLGEGRTAEQQLKEPITAAEDYATAQGAGDLAGAGIKAAANLPIVQKGAGKINSALAGTGEWLSGVPKKVIQTFAKNPDEITSMNNAFDGSTADAADQMRKGFMADLDAKRSALNDQISGALKGNQTRVDGSKIIDAMNKAKSQIDPDLDPEQISKVDDLISKITKKIGPDGSMAVEDAHKVKRFLQDKATQAYRSPGDIFSVGTEGAKAAKSGAAVARQAVSDAVPEVADANAQLAHLHDIEDSMNSNLIADGKPEAGLISAGSGGNSRNAKALQKLGDATDTDMLGQAEKLAAMKTFGAPSFSPNTHTGAKIYHAGAGALLGGAAGYAEGGREGAIGGALAGAALSSPAAVKAAIQGGQGLANVARTAMSTPVGKQALGHVLMGGDDDTPSQSPAPAAPMSAPGLADQMKQSPRLDSLSKTNPKAFEAIQNAIQGRMKPKELDKDGSTSSQIPQSPAESQKSFLDGN